MIIRFMKQTLKLGKWTLTKQLDGHLTSNFNIILQQYDTRHEDGLEESVSNCKDYKEGQLDWIVKKGSSSILFCMINNYKLIRY